MMVHQKGRVGNPPAHRGMLSEKEKVLGTKKVQPYRYEKWVWGTKVVQLYC